MMEEQLNGTYRAVFDGLASDEECKKLANLGLVRNMFDWSNHSSDLRPRGSTKEVT
jgi:hypothetical protein